ncbi:MAG: fibronectin type III domain-containing protein [Acidimicrobiales bacterium]
MSTIAKTLPTKAVMAASNPKSSLAPPSAFALATPTPLLSGRRSTSYSAPGALDPASQVAGLPKTGLLGSSPQPSADPSGPVSALIASAPRGAAATPASSGYTAFSHWVTGTSGSTTVQLYANRTFYQASGGSWHPIDLSLVPATGGGWLTASADPGSARIADSSAGGLVDVPSSAGTITLSHPGAANVSAAVGSAPPTGALHSLASSGVAGLASLGLPASSVATYSGALASGPVSEALTVDGFEESVSLSTATASPSYTESLSLPSGDSATQDGPGAIALDGPGGTAVATYGAGLATDASGAEQSLDVTLLGDSGGVASIRVSVASSWLTNPARVFPVSLDPSFISDAAGSAGTFDTYVNSDNCYGAYDGQDQLRTGFPVTGQNDTCPVHTTLPNTTRTILYFPSACPTAIVCSSGSYHVDAGAKLSLYNYKVNNNPAASTTLYGLASLPPDTLTDWANQPALASVTPYSVTSFAEGNQFVSWNATALVQRWLDQAGPTSPSDLNNGAELRAGATVGTDGDPSNPEYATTGGRYYRSGAYGAVNGTIYGPTLSFTYEATPGQPGAPSAKSANSSAPVTWTAPANNGGSAITGYTIDAYDNATGALTTTATACATCTTATVTGLSNGTNYDVVIYANNAQGASYGAHANAVTPLGVPSAPTNAVATSANQNVSATWSAPTSNGGGPITGYEAQAYTSGGSIASSILSCNATCRSIAFNGVNDATSYEVVIVAMNAAGLSAPVISNVVSTPLLPLGSLLAPTTVTAIAENDSANVSWVAPTTGGLILPIVSYSIAAYQASNGALISTTAAGSATSITVIGLTNGVGVYFIVTASTLGLLDGTSTASNTVVPLGAPFAPVDVTVSPGDTQASIDWASPPTQANGSPGDNGSPITSYTVVSSGGQSITTAPTASSATITGLTNGTAYDFAVYATNASGPPGTLSALSAVVTPAGVPFAPVQVQAVASDSSAAVAWQPAPERADGTPGNNGGALSSYVVTASPGGAQASASGSTDSTDVTGLTNGASYTFTVTASNAVGTSPSSSASDAVVPAGLPGAPEDVTASVSGPTSIRVDWDPPLANGSEVIDYLVTASNGQSVVVGAGTTSTTFNGLVTGRSYTFTVVAGNSVGLGPSATSNPATPSAPPSAPTNVSAVPGTNGTASVSWNAPASDGGGAISSYTVVATDTTNASNGNQSVTVSGSPPATTATVTHLIDGDTYTFIVTAADGELIGPASAPSAPITEGVPTSATLVTNVEAQAGDAKALVTWVAPTGAGTSAITGYQVLLSPACPSCRGTTVTGNPPATYTFVYGLTNGVGYQITVVPANASGPGTPSEPAAVIPIGYPNDQLVGLGDSYTAGEGNPPFDAPASSTGCDRSISTNYPLIAAQTLGLSENNFACSGAAPAEITTRAQNSENNTRQIDYLTGSEDNIALTTGPDGLNCPYTHCDFASILTACVNVIGNSNPTPCEQTFDVDNGPQVTDAINNIGPTLVSAYLAIHQASPTAEIYVLGYPTLFSNNNPATCQQYEGIRPSDVAWLIEKEAQLDLVIEQAVSSASAQAHGLIHFVDLSQAFDGHELCSGGTEWFNGNPVLQTVERHQQFVFHPNVQGQAQMASYLAAVIKSTIPPA